MSAISSLILEYSLNYFNIKMSGLTRAQADLQAELRTRMAGELGQGDLDFYIRKVRRLENDNNILQDQLNKVRVRLRRAEDYQIKYEILSTEAAANKKDLEDREKILRELKSNNEKLVYQLEGKTNLHQEWSAEKRGLLQEIEKWTTKAEESQIRRISELSIERLRAEEAIKRQIAIAKKDAEQKQEQLKFQNRQLKKRLHQKQAFQTIVAGRVQKLRKQKDIQIGRLSQVIEEQKQSKIQAIQEKNDQINKLKQKFQKMINFQLENVKKNLQDQGEVFSIELNGLKEIIAIKNDEIAKLLTQIKRQAKDHAADRKELISEIDGLKQKIYQNEKQADLELYNLRQKLMEIQAADLRDLEKRYSQLMDNLRSDKSQLQNYIREKDRLREDQRKDHERNIAELADKIKERDQRINSLLERIKQSGDLNTGELKNLHESFHKIEVEKESLSNDYQTNINFMTQQISKLTKSNEVKNAQIKLLHDQIHQVKIKFQQQLKDLNDRHKDQRKSWDQQREQQRKQKQRLSEQLGSIQRNFKNEQRRLIRQKQREQREKNKLKFICEQLEKDIDRLNKYIKSLDQNLKNQYKKSQMAILDGDGSKREITSQLNKQRVEIETLKNIEIDQAKRKYETQTVRTMQQNERLKTDLLNKSLALEKAETELKRLDYQQRNMQKINKDKLLDYQKKMATLNSEINLTQQLYKTFLDAKSKKKQAQ